MPVVQIQLTGKPPVSVARYLLLNSSSRFRVACEMDKDIVLWPLDVTTFEPHHVEKLLACFNPAVGMSGLDQLCQVCVCVCVDRLDWRARTPAFS